MVWIFGTASALAAELPSASRWDISLKPYKYDLQGDLVRAIKDYRTAVNQTGIQPSQDRQLRAESDRLRQLLDSRGYYQAQITPAFDDEREKPRYRIVLGERFRIASIDLQGEPLPLDDDWQSLKVGDPLSAARVLSQQSQLRSALLTENCFYQMTVGHEVQLNDDNRSAAVTFVVSASLPATFGNVRFEGTDGVNSDFLTRVTGIREGQCYQRADIDSAVISLFDTGLFQQVRPSFARDNQGRVPVTFDVIMRKNRTVTASLGWKSEQGFGIGAGWQHRNLLNRAQSLSLQGSLQSLEQSVSAQIVIPSFFDRRNRLTWRNEIQHQSVDPEFYRFRSTATLERKASNDDYFEYGIGFEQVNEKTDDDWALYQQLRVPARYRFDSVTDPFNPTDGWRWSVRIEPVFDIRRDFSPFFNVGSGIQVFAPLGDQLTLASRARADALIIGGALDSSLDNVPASELFTAGGSSSVRGYPYQSLRSGRFGDDDVELGGVTRALLVNELRLQFNDSWGAVAFFDAGQVAPTIDLTGDNPWYRGYGFGVRYYTRFAPIRLDMAFPLDARESDDRFQIYVSLGQAF